MKTHVGASLLLALVLWPGEAHLSRVHYRPIPLEQLVKWSELIVVAAPKGERRTSEIPVGEGAPAFTVVEHPYHVSAVLKGSLQGDEEARIWVAGADLAEQFSLHKKYYVDHISKSPIFDSYDAQRAPEAGARILFLRRTEFQGRARVVFTVLGAEEHIEQRDRVVGLLQKAD